MAAIDTSRNVGTENSTIRVGLGVTMESKAESTNTAKDTTVSGVADALAETTANAGVLNSTIHVGTKGTLTGSETGKLTATAENTTGPSTATSRNTGPTGGFINTNKTPNIIQTGLEAVLLGSADNIASAKANTVGGSSTALADTGKVTGFHNVGLAAGTGSSMKGTAIADNDATAEAVGLPLKPDVSSATAGSSSSLIKGIYNNDGQVKIAFGEDGKLTGTAAGNLTSTATNTNGAARASSLMHQVAGIANDGDGLEISMGLKGDVVATGGVKSAATSKTVTGAADSVIDVHTIGGLIDGKKDKSGSSLTIGTVGTLNAVAFGENEAKAEAVTTKPDEHVRATVDNDEVIAVRFPKIAIGTDAAVSAGAQSIQKATAIGVNNGGDPLARVAEGDKVVGIDHTKLHVGRNLEDFKAEAYLTGISSATGISSILGSNASSGLGSRVAGVLDSPIEVGQNTDGLNAVADSELRSTAVGITGPALAVAGSHDSSVSGFRHSDATIGRNGDVDGKATGLVVSRSTTIDGPSTAESAQEGRGIIGSTVKIGQSGNVAGSSTLGGAAASGTTTGIAIADLRLDSVGIDQTRGFGVAVKEGESTEDAKFLHHPGIWIGVDGNANGIGVVEDTQVVGSAITGSPLAGAAQDAVGVLAHTHLDAVGIQMGHHGSINIGNKGNVSGVGDAGMSEVEAINKTGSASAKGKYSVFGITGDHLDSTAQGEEAKSDGRTKITAGPNGGSILGRAVGAAELSSSTITGSATTGEHDHPITAVLVGVNKVDLQGGLVGGNNRITGIAEGDYKSSSSAVTGNATTESKVDVAGLLGDRNTAKVDGNVSGIAAVKNDVLATTVSGIASATSTSSAVGIGGYDIHILKDGVITASAISNSSATANSVTHPLV